MSSDELTRDEKAVHQRLERELKLNRAFLVAVFVIAAVDAGRLTYGIVRDNYVDRQQANEITAAAKSSAAQQKHAMSIAHAR